MTSIAVIIGASGGIGSAVRDVLNSSGKYGTVLGFSRSSRPAIDLLQEDSIRNCAEFVSGIDGDLQLLFDATGILTLDGARPEKSLRDLDPARLAKSFAVNAIGPGLLMKHFLPLFPRQGRGVFATLSARVGSIGDNNLGGWYAYRAAKAGLNQLVRTASVEFSRTHPKSICVALHPGTVSTRLTEGFQKTGLEIQEPILAAKRLLAVLDALEPEQSGGFFDHLGKPVEW